MALIITSQGQLMKIRQSWRMISSDGYSQILSGNVSNCEPQNNYTMEFEYLIYSNNLNLINHAVVVCGVQAYDWHTRSSHTCLGQSYGIIRYSESATVTTAIASTQPVHATRVLNEATPGVPRGGSAGKDSSSPEWALLTIVVIGVAIILIVILLIVGFLYMSSRSRALRRKGLTPHCVQTVEQTLVIKVDHHQLSGEEVKEKEASFSEDSNRSSVQVQLDQKLPDIISSRSKTL